jgi:hypothetical protein
MKTCGNEGTAPLFLTAALDRGGWSATPLPLLYLGKWLRYATCGVLSLSPSVLDSMENSIVAAVKRTPYSYPFHGLVVIPNEVSRLLGVFFSIFLIHAAALGPWV